MTEAEELVLRLRTHGAPASERIVGALIEGNRHRDMTIEEQRKVLEQALEALDFARNGLEWFADSYPQDINGSDDEAFTQIDAAITAIQEQLA